MTYLRKTLPHFALGLSLFPSMVVGQASTGAEANTDVSLIASPQSTASVNAGGPQLFFTGSSGAPADYGQPVGQSLVQIALDRVCCRAGPNPTLSSFRPSVFPCEQDVGPSEGRDVSQKVG